MARREGTVDEVCAGLDRGTVDEVCAGLDRGTVGARLEAALAVCDLRLLICVSGSFSFSETSTRGNRLHCGRLNKLLLASHSSLMPNSGPG